MGSREASHAGSWYTDSGTRLSSQLSGWIAQCEQEFSTLSTQERSVHQETGSLPKDGARVIIAPHAGYDYSGAAAAWAYRSLDLKHCKRVFLLGPSHHKHLPGCALSNFDSYSTPLGSLTLDKDTIGQLAATGKFERMSASTDTEEHSLEMHLPYVHLMLEKQFGKGSMPPLVPILVGSTNAQKEKEYGSILAPYLADPRNCFVVSSDFCHWGLRFSYTFYMPDAASEPGDGYSLGSKDKSPSAPTIAGSIARVDKMAMAAIESGRHDAFLENLQETGNTVCGRHPIGVIMAALEALRAQGKIAKDAGFFKFLRYERSSDCDKVRDSSVSYVSGYAVV